MNTGKKTLAAIAIVCCLALSAFLVSGCTQQQKTETASQPTTDITALVIYAQDGDYLFVDTETGTIFFPKLANAAITNSNGSKVSRENLAVGDIVDIAGDGAMTMSYPAIYPGITKVKIVSRGNMDDVDQYTDIIAMLYPTMSDEDIPIGWLFYETSVGNITLALDAYSYKGFAIANPDTAEEGTQAALVEQSLDGSYMNESGFILDGVADARFKDTITATISMSENFQKVTIDRQPVSEATGGRMRVGLSAPQETVEFTVVGNGELLLSIAPGYVYVVNVEFANGEAHYAFTTLDS